VNLRTDVQELPDSTHVVRVYRKVGGVIVFWNRAYDDKYRWEAQVLTGAPWQVVEFVVEGRSPNRVLPDSQEIGGGDNDICEEYRSICEEYARNCYELDEWDDWQ
jgi:hypothetical protein